MAKVRRDSGSSHVEIYYNDVVENVISKLITTKGCS